MNWPAYPEYKYSGIDWLGQVPGHWSMSKLGYESWVRARLGWKGLKADEYIEDGIAFLSTPNIRKREIDFENVDRITDERFLESPEIILRVGDVLLAKDGSTLGSANLVRHLPEPTTVNGSIAVLTPGQAFDSGYLFHLVLSSLIQSRIQMLKGGMGVPHLFQDDIRRFDVPIPPLEEQVLISSFLDLETAKIDALIDKQNQLITTLREDRTATITHAVTKGLNPNAEMKDSGVKSLGQIPEDWQSVPLKRLIVKIDQGVSPQAYAELADAESWGVLKSGCVNGGVFADRQHKKLPDEFEFDPKIIVREGDLLVCRASGSPSLVGSAAIVRVLRYQLILSDKIFRIVPDAATSSRYLEWVMNSRVYRQYVLGAISGAEGLANNLPSSELRAFVFPAPPATVQLQISEYLDSECARVDALIAKATEVIDTLREYRSALTTAAVTGIIDVREAA